MRIAVGMILLAGLAFPRGADHSTDVTGTVLLPAPKRGKKATYPGSASSERVRGPAIVFIDGITGDFKPSTEKAEIEQRGRQFRPFALAVLKGTTVTFPNRDDEYHNAFSRSDAKQFDLEATNARLKRLKA